MTTSVPNTTLSASTCDGLANEFGSGLNHAILALNFNDPSFDPHSEVKTGLG
jgi:hypothetical protein